MKEIFKSKIFRFVLTAAVGAGIYFGTPSCFPKLYLGSVIGILFLLINLSEKISEWRWITHISRILVGCLFIFSGFIKSNDPLGFSYKLTEYFEVFHTDSGLALFEWMTSISLPLAVIICVSEVALGFMLLIGFQKNLTLWLLLAQIVFFTFLTFYSACYNKVTHCGCFGDAIKLTPWESFWKDLILLIFITLLFSGKENIEPLASPLFSNVLTVFAIVASIAFPVYCIKNLPVIDFRPYAPGLSICDGMKPGANYKPAVYESHFIYTNIKTGEDKEFTDKNYPWQDTLNWKYKDALPSVVISPEVDGAKITDFSITDENGNTVTDSLLNQGQYHFFLVCYDLEKTEQSGDLIATINDFYTLCVQNKVGFEALTASSSEQINNFKHKHNALYNFYNADGTVLKTTIRANPGLILMKDCKVIANWHHNNFPAFSDVKSKLMN